jgi:hypothetical protein
MTMVGRFIAAITLARVKVFPEPVTPKSVLRGWPPRIDAVSSFIARGWSPSGLNFDTNWNRSKEGFAAYSFTSSLI